MNSIIVYYSHTGNTEKAANVLADVLQRKGTIQIQRLIAKDEARGFFGQCVRAFFKKRAKIEEVPFDLSRYDLICLGTPVWAFGPAPSMWTYLDKCRGLAGKNAVIFTTYGSGTGNEKCLNLMENALKEKGVKEVNRFSIQQSKVSDKDFILRELASKEIPYSRQDQG